MVTSRFRDGLIAEEWLITDLAERLLLARKRSSSSTRFQVRLGDASLVAASVAVHATRRIPNLPQPLAQLVPTDHARSQLRSSGGWVLDKHEC